MDKQKLLFEQLKFYKDYWVKASLDGLESNANLIWSDNEEGYERLRHLLKDKEDKVAYESILNELIRGVIHSLLVMIDGVDDLADKFGIDLVIEGTIESLKDNGALHEEFIGYLFDVEEMI
ncbi:histidine kinase [Psychrobacillus sp. NPDC093180]|uniref:histidine kinase n=1 Tax=Psychrobacillus sp. NPDC093180 TaxID=3364489 RepID=UPI00380716EC